MIKIPGHIVVSLFILLFAGVSCIKDDLNEMDKDLEFSPEYSLPIGEKEVTLNEYLTSHLPPQLPDTIGISKDHIFYFNNHFYEFDSIKSTYPSFLTFDFSKLSEKFESIESLMFRFNIENNIPAQYEMQISFDKIEIDTNTYGLIDTTINIDFLFNDGWFKIEPATYSNDGEIISTKQYKNDIPIDKNDIKGYADIRKINIQVRITKINLNDKIIEYLNTQSLKVQLALRFSFESTPNEL